MSKKILFVVFFISYRWYLCLCSRAARSSVHSFIPLRTMMINHICDIQRSNFNHQLLLLLKHWVAAAAAVLFKFKFKFKLIFFSSISLLKYYLFLLIIRVMLLHSDFCPSGICGFEYVSYCFHLVTKIISESTKERERERNHYFQLISVLDVLGLCEWVSECVYESNVHCVITTVYRKYRRDVERTNKNE